MFRKLLSLIALAGVSYANAQDSASVSAPLTISGSVDAYYKYDFSGYKPGNIGYRAENGYSGTSFATENNSISLGMIDVALKKTTGKASFVGEVSFGPRGQYQSIPNGNFDEDNAENSFNIQNLYATYAFTDRFSVTAGYMGTFVGYEVISPVGNYNYSTSYLFTNGPFQNAGIKANFSLSSKVGVMVGLFNDWNTYQDFNGVSHFGAQLALTPIEGWSAYLNVLTGQANGGNDTYGSGTVLDLTTAYQITDRFKLGLNAADYSMPDDLGGYSGIALYPQVSVTNGFSLGLRGEYFKWKDVTEDDVTIEGTSFSAITLSSNLKSGGLTFIPEIRFDNASENVFFKKNTSLGADTKSASQFSLAVVYAF
ncbi:porin [Paradesertivirga mongoliensis]|uniref:Porin n=1 Tax=Paradesertivirga mongoliensis TaxID=2100740 RepID=A0ABW4ZFU7_9SPHI|nr:porin [Pedobacter mongoliensis]